MIDNEEALDVCAYVYHHLPRTALMSFRPVMEPHPTIDCLHILNPMTLTIVNKRIGAGQALIAQLGCSQHQHIRIMDSCWVLEAADPILLSRTGQETVMILDWRYINVLARMFKLIKDHFQVLEIATAPSRFEVVTVLGRVSDWQFGVKKKIMGAFTVHLRQVYSLSFLWYILGLTVSGAFYGGLHLTAWANQFPSKQRPFCGAQQVSLISRPDPYALCLRYASQTFNLLGAESNRQMIQP